MRAFWKTSVMATVALMLAGTALGVTPIRSPFSNQRNVQPGVNGALPQNVQAQPPGRVHRTSELDEQMGDTLLVSTTWRDQLGTSSYTRFLAYTEDDPDYAGGVVKVVWQEHATETAGRLTHYTEIHQVDGAWVMEGPYDVGLSLDGYPVLDIDDQGREFIALHSQHWLNDGLWDPAVMTPSPWVTGFFDYHWVDRHADAQAVWPKLAMQNYNGNLYAHTVNFASGGTFDRYMFYHRMAFDEELNSSNATPGSEDQLIVQPWDEDLEGVVASNDAGVVAIVAPVSRMLKDGEDNGYYEDHRMSQTCNDVYLWTSTDGGETWDWDTPLNITDFIPADLDLLPDTAAANKDTLRAYSDVNCVVDNEGIIHVTWTTVAIDFVRSQGESSYPGRLWYWNSRDSLCIQMQEYFWNGAIPGAWQTLTNQCQLSVDENNGYVWAAWSQYGSPGDTIHYTEGGEEYYAPLDASTAGYALGDIFVSVSPDGHRWAQPVNVTDTRDMTRATALAGGVEPGDCRSEVHPSLAENVSGDYLHLFYLLDRDGGRSNTWEEGTATQGELIYQRVLKQAVIDSIYAHGEWMRNYPIHYDSSGYWADERDWEWWGLEDELLSVDERHTLQPSQFELEQNYPNPFNPSTRIAFNLRAPGHVKLAVYDILGREVATLLNRSMEAGSHSINFLADDLPSGVYFCKLSSGDISQVRKMVLMK